MSNLSLRQLVAPASAAALVLLIGATPAAARPDAGVPVAAAAATATSGTSGTPTCASASTTTDQDMLTKFRRHGI